MGRPLTYIAGIGAAALALAAATVPQTATAQPAEPNKLTLAQIAALSPEAQGRILDPLRAIAAAAGQAGKTTEADIYSSLKIDAPDGRVDVYLTDPSKAADFIKAAKQVNKHIDATRITVLHAQYTLRALHAARNHLLAQEAAHQLPYKIYTAAVATDGSGLQVGVDKPDSALAGTTRASSATARRDSSTAANVSGVSVTFSKSQHATTTSWSDTKWHDSSPYIGGDQLTDGNSYCSAGLPAVRTSDNKPFMITAGHCFTTGTEVFTGAGATPTMGHYYDGLTGSTGNYVGTVASVSGPWDAETLSGSNNNSDESDSTTWHPVTSSGYSYNGDLVCQDGVASFFMQQGTVCGIDVTNQDITYSITDWSGTHNVRGVEGTRLSSNIPWAVAHGDSGTMVFSVSGSTRQARGIDSAGSGPCCYSYGTQGDMAFNYILWTEAPDILGHFGMKLNPAT
ncbi:chymotrypsin family serine protease [Streptomyces mirabilis]|uniref:peptidase n=1 Tax=Streptomyces mirabilis TaxID=68239 RepID=UPI0036A75C11